MTELSLTGKDLSLATLADFDVRRPQVSLADEARSRMQASVDEVRRAVRSGKNYYGINTGFGAFANRRISAKRVARLQYNLVCSHASGLGEPLPAHLVRLIMLLKANSLAAGYSGIRPEVVDTLLTLLNHDVVPVIPSRGSVGASGDLAPLAHLTLALIGEGEAERGAKRLSGPEVLEASGCEPIVLEAKEGLALLNGTQVSAALAIDGLIRADTLLLSAIVIGALTVEGIAGSHVPFDARIQAARGFEGQIRTAEWFRSLLTESEIHRSHADCDRVQDPYSARCMPQVFGAIWDTLTHAANILARECNSVSDNPLIFGQDILSGGNFHAAPLGYLSDFIGVAVTDIASMSERRTDLLDRRVNPKLNMFLATEPGLESGFMIAHVAATALASENKTLAHPASVDSISTSAGQEDHVSMATWAGLKLRQICGNTAHVLAIELLAAAHAIDDQRPLRTTAELEKVQAFVRSVVPLKTHDHRLDTDIVPLTRVIEEGQLLQFLGDPPVRSFDA